MTRGAGCAIFFVFPRENLYNGGNAPEKGEMFLLRENEEDHPLSTPQPSQNPQSIRLAKMLLYIRVLTALAILVMNIRYLITPPAEEQDKIDQLTAGQLTGSFLLMLLPIVVAIVTLIAINKKKRLLAIVMSLVLLFVSSVFSPLSQIDMLLVAVIAVMLFSRSARAYFSGIPMPVPVGRAAGSKRVAAHSVEHAADVEGSDDADNSDENSLGQPAGEIRRSRSRFDNDIEIRPATAQDATTIYSLMMEAFEEYRAAVPPSSALDETIDSVREALQGGQGAAILLEDARPTAMVRYEIEGETIHFFRLSVVPSRRRRGYAKQLVKWVEHLAVSKGLNYAKCKVRQTVQNNVTMYENMGYEIVDQELAVRPGGTVKTLLLEKKLGV